MYGVALKQIRKENWKSTKVRIMKKIAFVFAGQGSQYVGMCRDLYQDERIVKELFDEASRILGFSLSDTCFYDKNNELNTTYMSQLSIFVSSVAQAKCFLQKNNIAPDYVAGNSVGEYAALVIAGVMSFEDALKLLNLRARYMNDSAEEKQGSMYAVRHYPMYKVQSLVDEYSKQGVITISNINGKDNYVISGETKLAEETVNSIDDENAVITRLNVKSGFHSMLMESAYLKLTEYIKNFDFSEPRCTVLSNVTGKPYKNAEEIRNTLAKQIVSTVRWYDMIRWMEKDGCTDAIEFGPMFIMRNLILGNSNIKALSYDKPDDLKIIMNDLSFRRMMLYAIGAFMSKATAAKNNNHDEKGYVSEVVQPYREIEKLYDEVKNTEFIDIDSNHAEMCKRNLDRILRFKNDSAIDNNTEEIYSNMLNLLIHKY